MILSQENKCVAIFVFVVIILSTSSIIFSAYFTCFGYRTDGGVFIFDLVMEGFFALDIGRNFIQEYTDLNNGKLVREMSDIAKNYVTKGSFLYDLIAILALPVYYLVRG